MDYTKYTINFTFTFKNNHGEYVYTDEEGRKKFKEVLNQESILYIDCSTPINKKIEVNMGKTEIFFTDAHLYDGNGVIDVDNNLGKIIFHVPLGWIVECDVENSLGSVKMAKSDHGEEDIKYIKVKGNNSLGKIEFIND